VKVARSSCSVQIGIVRGVRLDGLVIQSSQPGDFAAYGDLLVCVDGIVAVHATCDTEPHDCRRLNFVDYAVQIIAEHASSQRLTTRLQEGDHTSNDCVQGTEDSDQHPAAVACAKTCESSTEYDLGK
jgi:hypothetical protein